MRFAVLAILLAAASAVPRSGFDKEEMRGHIKERMLMRENKMKELIELRSKALEDHATGRRLLEDEEHQRFTRQVKNFKLKLERNAKLSSNELEEMVEHELVMMETMSERMKKDPEMEKYMHRGLGL